MSTKISRRQQKQKKLILEQLRKIPIVQVCSERTGISRATYYRWLKEDKSFAKEAEKAMSDGIKLVNDLAESKLINGIQEQNTTCLIYWLKNHHPTYKDKLEVSAKNNSDDEPLTEEQQATVEKALMLSPIKIPNPKSNDGIRQHNSADLKRSKSKTSDSS